MNTFFERHSSLIAWLGGLGIPIALIVAGWLISTNRISGPVDLGKIKTKIGDHPDGVSWVKTPITPALNGGNDVGWFSFDNSYGLQPGGFSLHYGAQNNLSYSTGWSSGGNKGTIWSPAFKVDPNRSGYEVSFQYSFELADPSRASQSVDRLCFSYSFDGKLWTAPTSIVKGTYRQPWTTFTTSVSCAGNSALWLKWEVDTVNGNYQGGRGWNLQALSVK